MSKLLALCTFRFCGLLILLLAPPRTGAQSLPSSPAPESYPIANQFEHLSAEDGLSNNYVTAILQDQDGFMWFGTADGLNKYDGSTFTVFKPNPGEPSRSFQNGFIMGLCAGDANQLWVVTDGGGLHEVNRKTGQVIPHLIHAPQANRWNTQLSVYRDQQRMLWISTQAGLARYEPAKHHFTLYPSPVADIAVKTVFEDRQHRFWVATHQGLYLFNRSTGQFTLVPLLDWKSSQPSFQSFYLDQNEVLWLGTATAGCSLFKLDLRKQPWQLIPYNPGRQLNPYIWRNTIHRDTTGLVWVGTTTGLQVIDPTTDRVFTYQSTPNDDKGLSSSSAQAVYHDRSGMLWVGTDNGIDRRAANTKPFSTYQVKPNVRGASMPDNRAFAVFQDKRGQLWFNNSPTLYRLSADQRHLDRIPAHQLGNSEQHANEVTAFLPDEKEGIWMGSYDGLYHYEPASGQLISYPSEIPAQFIAVQYNNRKPSGDIWVGGERGFASFNPRTYRYTYYKYRPGDSNGIPDQYVYGMLVSQTGDVWIIINHLGLCRLNPATGKMIRYSAGDLGELSTNEVLTLYEDDAGIIWIGTHRGGLNRFDPRTGLFSVISHQDGIPGNTIVGITGDASGQLWLSTNAGLCRINPRTKAIHTYTLSDGLPSDNFKQNAVFRNGDHLIFGSENGIVQFNPAQIRDDTRPFPVHITRLSVLDKPRPLTDKTIRLNHDENLLTIGFAALTYEQPIKNQYAYQLVGINKDWVPNGNRTVASFNSLPPGDYTFRVKAANANGFWSFRVASLQLIVLPPWWATWWAYGGYSLLLVSGIWGAIRFFTHRIRQRQELELNRRQAEQLKIVDELKTRFFANITHEFRTPLSLIIAPVEKLLHESRFDGPILTQVHQNAEKLLRLINQLLDLAKLEGHHMNSTLRRGLPNAFIDQLLTDFRPAAEQKNITFTWDLKGFPPQELVFDADKWEKIVTNLVANALKFTGAGGHVRMTVEPVRGGDEPTGVHFQLVDSGIGIGPQQLPHIFDRFYQVDTSTTRAHEGTGLGLALVHELIQLLGGQITVESELGIGTTFRWTLPVGPGSATEELPLVSRPTLHPLPVEVSSFREPVLPVPNREPQPAARILIVEDNVELREFLVGELTPLYQVLAAGDGQEGWDIAQAELPDIVLTDVMMPRLDGYELCQLIKNHPDTDHVAVVMLTAKATQPSRIQGLEQGADEYLSKPFSMVELRLRLQNLRTRQQKLGAYYRRMFTLPEPPSDSPLPPANFSIPILSGTADPFLRRVFALLDEHLDDTTVGVDWLADALAMSRKTLYRKLQSLIQLPPADLIRQYRIRKGADFLLAGHSVAETADLVGFSTPSYFSLVFKEMVGQTPTEFVARHAKTT
ncbi:two-component regulator propeller domain-containing protein [Larkinella harenae]